MTGKVAALATKHHKEVTMSRYLVPFFHNFAERKPDAQPMNLGAQWDAHLEPIGSNQ